MTLTQSEAEGLARKLLDEIGLDQGEFEPSFKNDVRRLCDHILSGPVSGRRVSMTDLSDLIARLEAAKEGSRELDALIAVAIFETQKTDDDLIYAKECTRSDNCAAGTYWHVQRSGMSLRTTPFYTTSLEEALTLVPADHNIILKIYEPGENVAFCLPKDGRKSETCTNAATPALALCIAALKAREARR